MEYESASYELYIPLISLSKAKKYTELLCKNMGGCLGPEDVYVEYKSTNYGVKVSWGGGC